MAKFEVIGDEKKLSKGPRNYDRSRFTGGKVQQTGDQVKLSATPVAMQSGNKHISGGSYQQVGDSVTLSKQPRKGWESYPTPVSDRTKQQSVMPGISGKAKKN